MRTAIALSAALLTSVAALSSQKANSVTKRQGQGYDFNEVTWQGIACKVRLESLITFKPDFLT